MSQIRIVRFLDYNDGSLLVLTDDFIIERGWRKSVRPDFSWLMMDDKGKVGYSIDGLEDEPPDKDFLKSLGFRVMAPQLRLFNAGVDDVAAEAYSFFVEKQQKALIDISFEQAFSAMEESHNTGELIHSFESWSLLYHLHGNIDALFWMGHTSAELGMHEEAIRWLEKFLEVAGDNAEAHCKLGSVYFSLGNAKETRRHWDTAACIDRLDGSDSGAANLLQQLASHPDQF
jgi:tetratricopeptide (TPR) repeat protein